MPLHRQTPLVPSTALSRHLGRPVWLKLESAHPCASFKLRGMGLACERALRRGARVLVTSSGGNAGYAVAWAARALGTPAIVVVPRRTSERMRGLIAAEGARIEVHGEVWDDAHERARVIAANEGGALLHPFDDPDVWDGHATLVDELADQLATEGAPPPSAVVVAVGGGGLLCGVARGLDAHRWDARLVAVETTGAASYAAALAAGRPVTLTAIDSVALTLGAKTVCAESVRVAARREVAAWQCDDRSAIAACGRLLDDHRVLVEPACGAALAAVYERAEPICTLPDGRSVVVVVCGGAAVTREALAAWAAEIE